MLFRKRQKGMAPDRRQSLAAIPLRNSGLSVSDTDDGNVRLRIPRKNAWWVKVLDFILTIPGGRTVELDEIGSKLYRMCDGETTVDEIIRRMARDLKLNKRESELSVVKYLKMLAKRGIIALAVPAEKED